MKKLLLFLFLLATTLTLTSCKKECVINYDGTSTTITLNETFELPKIEKELEAWLKTKEPFWPDVAFTIAQKQTADEMVKIDEQLKVLVEKAKTSAKTGERQVM